MQATHDHLIAPGQGLPEPSALCALHDAERTVSEGLARETSPALPYHSGPESAATDAKATLGRLQAPEWSTQATDLDAWADIDRVMAGVAARLRPACKGLAPEELDRLVEEVVLVSVRYAVAWTETHTGSTGPASRI